MCLCLIIFFSEKLVRRIKTGASIVSHTKQTNMSIKITQLIPHTETVTGVLYDTRGDPRIYVFGYDGANQLEIYNYQLYAGTNYYVTFDASCWSIKGKPGEFSRTDYLVPVSIGNPTFVSTFRNYITTHGKRFTGGWSIDYDVFMDLTEKDCKASCKA